MDEARPDGEEALERRARAGDADAQWQLGCLRLLDRDDGESLDAGFRWLASAAERSPERAERLAMWILHGEMGLSPSADAAIPWLRRAASAGRGPAQRLLGVLLLREIDGRERILEAERLLRRAAANGVDQAVLDLAAVAWLVRYDLARAERYARQALLRGVADAPLFLEGMRHRRRVRKALGRVADPRRLAADAASGDPEAVFRWGLARLDGIGVERNVEAGLAWIERAVEKRHADARILRAFSHALAEGGPAEPAAAFRLFVAAGRAGDPVASYAAGWLREAHLRRGGFARARPWYERAAGSVPWAAFALVSGLEKAQGHTPASVASLRHAATLGDPRAQFELCMRAYAGYGAVPEDRKAALDHLARAREQGMPSAHAFSGLLAEVGNGQEPDLPRAVAHYREAVKGGNPVAMGRLGDCCWDGRGTPVDRRAALAWFRRGAAAGDPVAGGGRGRARCLGEGVRRDRLEAIRWLEEASAGGQTRACGWLGRCWFEEGEDRPGALASSARWFRRGVAAGDPESEVGLGICHLLGAGVRRSPRKALELFRLAKAHGHDAADRGIEAAELALRSRR